ncbi:hypothetical protein [Metallosphaera hakonensis]|uniref:Uncharacterized protein n=1 Tax=Metallosphaera hakonensis JCM 8857 = DSM 7519 TaxID=1293036 RepID=A0A2U9IUQ3_9CREN|nr:hypothetical protein [Metallosphaera hakonensis]AWR99758.1 hypothetical protein DFR87_08715 [Metallosphaera hakonensis JCM 8857 = DSM 7519]
MKLRIDKLPKTDEDLEEIQREVESSHHDHEHHEHSHGESDLESILGELYVNYQSLESKTKELEEENQRLKKELANVYRILSHIVTALVTNNAEDKRKSLNEILSILAHDNR